MRCKLLSQLNRTRVQSLVVGRDINSFYAEISSERLKFSQVQYLKRIIIKSVALKLIVKYKFLCRCKSLLFCSEIYFILTVENLGTVKL